MNKFVFIQMKPTKTFFKLINYDFEKYGNKETRAQLLGKWDNDVSNLPK